MGLAFSVAPHMADAFLDDDAPAVMATDPSPAPIPAAFPRKPQAPRPLGSVGATMTTVVRSPDRVVGRFRQ